MCRRIGLTWKCDCKWRGWLHCDLYFQTGTTGALCLNSRTMPKSSEPSMYLVDWCCSPECCQQRISGQEDRIQEAIDQGNRSDVDDCWKAIHHDRAQRLMEFYAQHCLTVCLRQFLRGYWKSNSMRRDMKEWLSVDKMPAVLPAFYKVDRSIRETTEAKVFINNVLDQYRYAQGGPRSLSNSIRTPVMDHYETVKKGVHGYHRLPDDAIYGRSGHTEVPMKTLSAGTAATQPFTQATPSSAPSIGSPFEGDATCETLIEKLRTIASKASEPRILHTHKSLEIVDRLNRAYRLQCEELDSLKDELQNLQNTIDNTSWLASERIWLDKEWTEAESSLFEEQTFVNAWYTATRLYFYSTEHPPKHQSKLLEADEISKDLAVLQDVVETCEGLAGQDGDLNVSQMNDLQSMMNRVASICPWLPEPIDARVPDKAAYFRDRVRLCDHLHESIRALWNKYHHQEIEARPADPWTISFLMLETLMEVAHAEVEALAESNLKVGGASDWILEFQSMPSGFLPDA